MTPNPPVAAAPVEERHWQAAVDTNHTTRANALAAAVEVAQKGEAS